MTLFSALVVVILQATSALASTCCNQLQQLGDSLSFPKDMIYNATVSSFWSIQESGLRPACVLRPATVLQVSKALEILSGNVECKFAIKGGGHAPAAGFANVNRGVLIDLTTLSSVSLNQDSSVASVGAGAKWLDVYQHLDESGVQVAGGRNGNVGVGGLLLGGGISHFTTQVGWACDNVVNYEIVLANGTIINADKTNHPDMFLALKGGGNNLGVVTRFDLATFPQGDISTTTITYNISQRVEVFEIFSKLIESPKYDPLASLITSLLYRSATKTWTLSSSAVYTEPVAQPAFYADLFAIPHETLVKNITSLAEYSNEKDTFSLRSNWHFATITLKPCVENIQKMFDTLNDTIYSFEPEGGVTWSIALEPLVAAMLPSSGDRDILGLERAYPGFIVLISALWPNSTANSEVEAKARSVLSTWEADAQSRGLLQDFQYLNYAAPHQRPLHSYGKDRLDFLKLTSEKYDPPRIFQKNVGGFKLQN
ncbi:unnamed protein product [Clonostachys rhizophaga]|uniref:FAD-binding PCMH-type domain-containing protein n=1 Tax=Clonostachys rhizophaga TaxID=160324 RepID=A0A9N9V9W8_9HYPO|nr:unnamed protein product [Clonostachys rhizophaga]